MIRLTITISTLLLCLPLDALAERSSDVDSARDLDRRAEEAFREGDHARALELMEAAQALAPATSRLYNMGVLHQRLGQDGEAIELFEEFVEAPDAPDERRERARERIEELRGEPVTDRVPERFGDGDSDNADPPRERRHLSTGPFWGMVGATSALSVALLVMGAYTMSFHSQFEENKALDFSEYTVEQEVEDADRGHNLALATNVLIGVTAAAAVATLVLAFFTNFGDSDSGEASLRLLAGPTSGGGTLGVDVTF